MNGFRICVALVLVLVAGGSFGAEPFTLFPDRQELHSPDGKFVIRSVEQAGGTSEFTGVFRSLVLEEVIQREVPKTLRLRWPCGGRLVGESLHHCDRLRE